MDSSKWPVRAILPIAQPGLKFILITILFTGMLFYFGWILSAWIFFAVTLFICWFFRDPDRAAPEEENCLISPADGKIIILEKQGQCDYLKGPCIKVSIFMNVFNVHVNRIPFNGKVQKVEYHPGKFMNASFDKASSHNERNALMIRTDDDKSFAVVQIAGLVARRIVNCVKEGETVKKGDRYGMIQFGSRLDLYLPEDFKIAVKIGEKTKAGSTIIGYMQ
ncbi:MAG: phosphatidylserine decarboxylase family protein [Desulfobacula sp.]|jgi:phosphatidylserine decarboxylase|uniref:phosphatidylserine decarboxylase family protein n=1 Tax=Desulfobacula sp. TaxID=2593537 RepID=UPI001D49314A|nr:phosphatidylserine decarboxylase family protein [Desulfobacula sp.]MBT3485188.1 phosphatidylserine decarboxylase family protein [Desulfobacula sp.]MBT3804067.1 phosphatidylserine decarboxylase family protein [Desulfobacula sp.]MBT4026376.1 phosphatidylserine decarboxylase family protein [Desulfobacula sp.]MBT4200476.1 phosphatidylserine decarboxylase family protein [Desulfobacula sp.]